MEDNKYEELLKKIAVLEVENKVNQLVNLDLNERVRKMEKEINLFNDLKMLLLDKAARTL